MRIRALLVDGPAEGQVVDAYGRSIYWPIRRPATFAGMIAEAETDPAKLPTYDKAEYRVDRLPSAQWDGEGREYNAIGVYIMEDDEVKELLREMYDRIRFEYDSKNTEWYDTDTARWLADVEAVLGISSVQNTANTHPSDQQFPKRMSAQRAEGDK